MKKKLYIAPGIAVLGVEMGSLVLSGSSSGESRSNGNVSHPGCEYPTLEDLSKSGRTDVCPLKR